MNGRDLILSRVRAAIAGSPPPVTPVPAINRVWEGDREAMVERFLDRLRDYNVGVTRTSGPVAPAVASILAGRGIDRLAIPSDLPAEWRPDGVALVPDDNLPYGALNAIPGALTGAAMAIAETGSIVLDGGTAQGRRALTLLPDYHLCVVRAEQLVGLVPEAIAALVPNRPITFCSGPSATADIELDRVVGVHGPRRLDVLFVG